MNDIKFQTGRISRIQRFSVGDGPGIRSTVFMQGCPLNCPWCHNPETIPSASIMFYAQNCVNCNTCISVCQNGCDLTNGIRENCTLCGTCAENCLYKSLEYSGKTLSALQVFDEISSDRDFYDTSGGGLTLSGGEPLMQPEFSAAIASLCRDAGIPVLIDTSAAVDFYAFETVLPYVNDYFIDIKMPDENSYREICGVGLSVITQNIVRLTKCGANITARIPIIPGYNADINSVFKMVETALVCGIKRISLLPFHRLGISKYEALGLDYACQNTVPPTPEFMSEIENRIKNLVSDSGAEFVSP